MTASPAGSQNLHGNATFTATVTPASGTQYPSGTVAFYDGTNQIGATQPVTQVGTSNIGTASITINNLPAGIHNAITAQYTPAPGNNLIASGSSMNLAIGDPTDNPISYTINAPQATGVTISPIAGQPFTGVVATFSDGLQTNPAGFSATIDWGDGHMSSGVVAFNSQINQTNINGAIVDVILFTVSGTNTYAETGSFPITVTITDPGNNTATVNPNARVASSPLLVSSVAAINANITTNLTNQTVATFTDPGLVANLGALGINDPTTQFTASIDWGDTTSSSAGTITYDSSSKIFSVKGSHTYAQPGTYTTSVTVQPLTLSVERIDSSDPNNLNEVGDEINNGITDSPSGDFIDHFVIGAANQTGSLYTFSLPNVSTTSGNRALTNSSYSVSEGSLSLSTNGQYLVTGGYNNTVSLWAPQQTFSPATVINRVIGRINGAGVIDTTTALTDTYTGDNFRGVVSTDGTQFWTAGHSGDTSDFVHYAAFGASTSTILTGPADPSNINTIGIFNGQLYEGVRSVSTGAPAGIYQIGTGLPTASGQTQTLFIQVPQSNPLDVGASEKPMSPFGFYMTALNNGNPLINGVNVAYIADAEMGIMRYDYTNTGWQFAYYITSTGGFLDSAFTVDANGNVTATNSFNPANPAASADPSKAGGVRGLTGRVVNGQVQLFCTTGFGTGAQPNPGESVIQVTDTGASAGFMTLATNTGASVFPGIAFTPFQMVSSTVNVAPSILSGPTANPNPTISGIPTTFNVTTSPADATVMWNFGDAATASGETVTHTYTTSGTETVTVTATSGGQSATSTFMLQVGSPVPAAKLHGTIKIKNNVDAIKFSTTLPNPTITSAAGQTVTLRVNGQAFTFTLSSKGKAVQGTDSFDLVRHGGKKPSLTFSATMNGSFGLTNTPPSAIAVEITVGGSTYGGTGTIKYNKPHTSGSFKN